MARRADDDSVSASAEVDAALECSSDLVELQLPTTNPIEIKMEGTLNEMTHFTNHERLLLPFLTMIFGFLLNISRLTQTYGFTDAQLHLRVK